MVEIARERDSPSITGRQVKVKAGQPVITVVKLATELLNVDPVELEVPMLTG